MTLPKTKRLRSKAYLSHVGTFPCLACSVHHMSVAHHIQFAEGQKAMALKVSDEWVVPLCTPCHSSLHGYGDEAMWWDLKGIDPIRWSKRNYSKWLKSKEA